MFEHALPVQQVRLQAVQLNVPRCQAHSDHSAGLLMSAAPLTTSAAFLGSSAAAARETVPGEQSDEREGGYCCRSQDPVPVPAFTCRAQRDNKKNIALSSHQCLARVCTEQFVRTVAQHSWWGPCLWTLHLPGCWITTHGLTRHHKITQGGASVSTCFVHVAALCKLVR